MNIFKVLMAFASVICAHTQLAVAQNEDVFVVPRVPVQAQADSAREAKSAAQSQGRRRAMDILLRRLTVEEDWVYLPNLRAGVEADAGPSIDGKTPIVISPQDLLALESGFVVYGEKSSSKTYRAHITYRFKPDELRRLLRASRIPYSEAQTRTALVLPVLQTDNDVYLWEENNPWMAAWKARPYTHELTPMTAPLGDLEDSARITARQALALDEARLQSLAEHYSVSQVIVAHARLRQKEGKDQVSVRLINGYRESGQLAQPDELGDIIEQVTGDAVVQTPVNDFAADVGDVLGQAFLSDVSGNFPVLAERAIELSIAKYSKGWKARTLIDYGTEALLESTAFFASVQEWAKIRSALVETPLVGSVQVSALSKRGAEMRMRVFGDPSRLVTALESQGLVLWTETGERWFVAVPATAQRYRGQRFLRQKRRGLFGETQTSEQFAPQPASDVYQPEPASKVSN